MGACDAELIFDMVGTGVAEVVEGLELLVTTGLRDDAESVSAIQFVLYWSDINSHEDGTGEVKVTVTCF